MWTVKEELPIGDFVTEYKPYANAWHVTFAGAAQFSLVIPQLCNASDVCVASEFSNAPRSCAQLHDIFNNPSWINENLRDDLGPERKCPASFSNLRDAQELLGSALTKPAVHVTSPLGLRLYNNPALMQYAYTPDNSTTQHVAVRLLLLTDFSWAYGFRELVIKVVLETPKFPSLATLAVESTCKANGLAPPAGGAFQVVLLSGEPVCVGVCPPDRLRHPWNAAPGSDVSAECRQMPTLFTATEFAFVIVTEMLSTAPDRLAQAFYEALDGLALSLELTLGQDVSVVLTVPNSIYDTIEFNDIIQHHVAATYHPRLLADTNNETLVINALKTTGLYDEVENTDFVHSWRRSSMNDITVKGLVISEDPTTTASQIDATLRDAVTVQTYAWAPEFRVVAVTDVDVQRLHRASAPTHTSLPSQNLQHAALTLLIVLASLVLLITIFLIICRQSKHKPCIV